MVKSSLTLFFLFFLATISLGADALSEKITARRLFIDNHCRIDALLTAIEKQDWQEDELSFVRPKELPLHFNPHIGESPEKHLQRYFDFALARSQFAPPLYSSNELHCPDRYFNVYGCGAKTDLAQVIGSMFKTLFYSFTINGNEDRCLFRISYDEASHYHGLTGKKVQKSPSLPETPLDTSFSKLQPDTLVPANSTRRFLSELYVLATDGSLGPTFSLSNYENRMANFINEVTLDGRDELAVKSYFPIVAAFIFVPPSEAKTRVIKAPHISVSLNGRALSLPVAEGIDRLGGFYYDCTSMLAHLEAHPQYALRLSKLKDLKGARVITVHPYCRANALKKGNNPPRQRAVSKLSLADKLQRRRDFLSRYTKRHKMIEALASKENHLVILKNEELRSRKIDCSAVFPSTAQIVKKLSQKKIGRSRGIALYHYLEQRFTLAVPLYSGKHYHWPSRFISTYGCGWCDDTSFIISNLAIKLGMDGRVWALEGHVIAEVFWQDKWHIFDLIEFAYPQVDGKILSLAEMIELAPKKLLKGLEYIVLSTNDNQVYPTQNCPQVEPYINMLPGERRHFLNRPFALVTDGRRLFRYRICKDKWSDYDKYLANQVRVIPLQSLGQKDGIATLKDYFPMGSLHIELPQESGLSQQNSLRAGDEFPFPQVAIDGIEEEHWFGGEALSERVRDYSVALAHLEDEPTLQIKIRNIEALLTKAPKARLVSSHVYCYRNAKNMTKVWRQQNVLPSLLKMKK